MELKYKICEINKILNWPPKNGEGYLENFLNKSQSKLMINEKEESLLIKLIKDRWFFTIGYESIEGMNAKSGILYINLLYKILKDKQLI